MNWAQKMDGCVSPGWPTRNLGTLRYYEDVGLFLDTFKTTREFPNSVMRMCCLG